MEKNKEIKLDCEHVFPTAHTFWNESPRFIVNGSGLDRLDPSRDSNVAMILRYQAMELLSSTFTVWEDTILSRDEIDEHAFFSGDSLNLNDGDGYRLDEHLTADHVFAVDVYGRISGVIGVYDDRSDDYEYFLIY